MRAAGARVPDVNTMSAMFLHRLATELDRHKPPTMAEANLQWKSAKLRSGLEELTQIEEEAAVAAAEQTLPVA